MHSLPIYQPTQKPTAKPCHSCANAFGFDDLGGFECRLLDDAANVEDDERETAVLTDAAWSAGTPTHCPGWAERAGALCLTHLHAHPADEGCMACEFAALAEAEP